MSTVMLRFLLLGFTTALLAGPARAQTPADCAASSDTPRSAAEVIAEVHRQRCPAGSRLRVAIASPTSRQPDADEIDPDTIPLAPSATSSNHGGGLGGALGRVNLPVGVAVAALLLGVAALRRRQHRNA